MRPEGTGLATVNATKVSTFNNLEYFSLNEAISLENLTGYTRSPTGIVTQGTNCEAELFYVVIGGIKQCLTSCPSHLPKYVRKASQERECVDECASSHHIVIEDSSICLESDCSSYGSEYLFWGSTGSTQCSFTCHGVNAYTDSNVCKDKCSIFVKDIQHFNTPVEKGTCAIECDQMTIQSPLYKWADNSTKTYCIPDCETFTTTHKYKTNDRRCVEDCQTEGFDFVTEDNFCSDSCSGFILENSKCVSGCPEELPLSEEQHCTANCSQFNPFIKEYDTCAKKCDKYAFEDICVDKCDEDALIQYLVRNERPYEALPFILSTGQCASNCSEISHPFINELSNECMSSCPPPCSSPPCVYEDLKYKDDLFYCRKDCSSAQYPFKDEFTLECLSKCKPERRFSFEYSCFEKCPSTSPLVVNQPICDDKSCNSECQVYNSLCVSKCPPNFPFKLTVKDSSECVCKCPQFFKNEGTECILYCDPSLGLVPNEDRTSCNHCFRDLGGMFFNDGKCVSSCPKYTSFNQNHICSSCDSLGLWSNESGLCLPYSNCDKLSHFDYENKTCTACNKKGFRITKKQNKLSCEQTDCSGGFISEQLSRPICVFCNQTEFFADPNCTTLCPTTLAYDFHSKMCIFCDSICSCCKNGTCRGNTCECDSGWTGLYCTTPLQNSSLVLQEITDFLNNRISVKSLKKNDNQLFLELGSIYDNSDLTDHKSIANLMSRTLNLILDQRVKYAYQPTILETLDNLVALSSIHYKKTKDRKILDQSIALLYSLTDDIQVFTTSMSVIPDFQIVHNADFKGHSFNISFGTDLLEEQNVDLSKCIPSIIEAYNLSPDHQFPFRLIQMDPLIESVQPDDTSFIISDNPLIMVWLYLPSGKIDLNTVCNQKFVDLTYDVYLPKLESQEEGQKFKFADINVLDKQDDFFNDRCVPFSDTQDVTLEQRKERFFVDASVYCDETYSQVCRIEELDANNKAKCVCKGIENTRKSVIKDTFASYPKSNYILITCLSVFRKAELLKNIGFYTILVPCIIGLVLIVYFNRRIDADLVDERRFQYMRTDIEIFDSDGMEAEIYFKECFNLKYRLNKGVNKRRLNRTKFDFNSLPTLPDLNNLPVNKQLALDQRTNWQYAKDILLQHNTLLYTIFSKSLIDPKPFLILLYVSELNMSVALNSFFIDDDLVDNFNTRKNRSLGASISSELPKTIWALITAKILIGILYFFYSFKSRPTNLLMKRLILTRDYSGIKAYNLFLSDHSWRLLALSFLAVPFNLFCIYFVVIYTEIYTKSIGIWFNGILMGLMVDNVFLQGLPAVFLVLTRTLAKAFPSTEIIFHITTRVNLIRNLEMLL